MKELLKQFIITSLLKNEEGYHMLQECSNFEEFLFKKLFQSVKKTSWVGAAGEFYMLEINCSEEEYQQALKRVDEL